MAEKYHFYVHDNRKITFNLTEHIMREDSGVTDFVFHIPKILNELEVSDWSWWLVFVNAKNEKYSIALTLSDDPERPLEYNLATYTVDYAMSIKAGNVQFALEAINAGTGGAIDNEWHTQSYEIKVKETLQGNQAEYVETESDIISALIQEVQRKSAALFNEIQQKTNSLVGGATPLPVNLKSLMTDHDKVYLYTGSESGESTGYWYHWNGTNFVPGGQYASGITIDPTLSKSGQAADAKVVGDGFALLNENKKKISFDLIADEYVKHDGTLEAYTGWSRTDYIDVSTQYEILVSNPYRATNYCHFYDADKNPIGNSFGLVIGENIVETNGASFVCISNNNGSINQGKLKIYFHNTDASLSVGGTPADAKAVGESINQISDKTDQLIINERYKLLNKTIIDWSFLGSVSYPLGWHNGRYNGATGIADNQNFYLRTIETVDIIATVIGAKYFNITVPDEHAVAVFEYDINGNFIRRIGDDDVRNGTKTTSIDIEVEYGHNYKFSVGRWENNDSVNYINDSTLINSFILTVYWDYNYGDIMPYYFPYLQDKVDVINSKSKTANNSLLSFVFITDYHFLRNAKQSHKLINYVCKNTGVKTVIFGGDAFQNWWQLSQSMRVISSVYNLLENAGGNQFLCLYGNHEWNDTVDQENTQAGVNAITINRVRHHAVDIDQYGNYYYDDLMSKTRIFFLGTNVSGSILWASILWLGNALLNVPSGYNVMVIAHAGLLNENGIIIQKNTYFNISKLLGAFYRHEQVSLYDSNNTFRGSFDYTSKNGTVICYLCGHAHEDLQILKTDDQNGVLAFSTTGDLYKQANGTHYTFVDENGNTITRNVGTIYEQAFDVIQIDTVNKKIYCTRIGAGQDRTFDY